MPEIWRNVVGYEGIYHVSNAGRVRSLPHVVRVRGGVRVPPGKLLSPRGPRPFVELWRGNLSRKFRVCRLVLEAFRGQCPEGMEACHYPNRDTTDNRLCNLRWDTRRNNAMDRDAHGTMLRGEEHYNAVLTDEMVIEARELRSQGWTYKRLQKRYGCGFITIYKAVVGRTWSHV